MSEGNAHARFVLEEKPAKICASCRWWWRPANLERGFGICALTTSGVSREECQRDYGFDPPRSELAEPYDGRFDGGLSTHLSFGCVQWEGRE